MLGFMFMNLTLDIKQIIFNSKWHCIVAGCYSEMFSDRPAESGGDFPSAWKKELAVAELG